MAGHVWDEPAVVGDHLIFTPYQAQSFLRVHQRNLTKDQRSAAESALTAAMDGRVSPDVARETFLAAVRLCQN